MQQEQRAKNGNDNKPGVQQWEKFQPPTLTAICVWVFVIFSMFFWTFLRNQIPVQSEYIKISVESMFNVALLILVVVQTGLYYRQAKALDTQEEIFREQARIMEDTLVVTNKATVGVHSIEMNKAQRTVLVRIENTGNRPAEHIKLFLQLVSFMPPEIGEEDQPITQESKRDSVSEDYGRTKLFKGNLPILLTFYLSKWSDEEFRLILDDTCGLVVDGYIDYSDGFSARLTERTEFFFSYLPHIDAWSAGPPDYGDILGRDEEEREKQPN